MSTGHRIMRPEGSKEDIGIHWRVVTYCWAATHAMQLDGDFFECGVNTGIMSGAVCKYLDFNKTGRSFWLFDTFEGIPDDRIFHRSAQEAGAMKTFSILASGNTRRKPLRHIPKLILCAGAYPIP